MKVCGCSPESYEQFRELALRSSGLFITGHANSDYDTAGSACGAACIARRLQKPVHIGIDEKTTLASVFVSRINEEAGEELVVPPGDWEKYFDDGTLLVITDTNRRALLECPRMLERRPVTAVIDHHRYHPDLEDLDGIFIHEPSMSSASEIVTRLMAYGDVVPDPFLCGMLAAGIALDTRGFLMNASAQTFYAAGSLFELGADPAKIQKAFRCTREEYRQLARIVGSAEVRYGCAVAKSRIGGDRIKILAPRAADELLTIKGIEASFVLYRTPDGILRISARSAGGADASEVMARFGGGGGAYMAAAQIPSGSFSKTEKLLWKYIEEIKREQE